MVILFEFEELNQMFLDRDYALLENQVYINSKTKFKYVCNKHKEKGILEISWNNFQRGKGCKYCGLERSASKQNLNLSFKVLEKEFSDRNYTLLPNQTYKNNTTRFKFICNLHSDHGIQEVSWVKFKNNNGCKICSNEKRSKAMRDNITYHKILSSFKQRGYILEPNQTYINAHVKFNYTCTKHKDKGVQQISWRDFNKGIDCWYCGIEKRSGENSYNWNGGISKLEEFLRRNLKDWKIESIKNCNYKCILSGKRFDDIHHLYSFSKILKNILAKLNILEKNLIINKFKLDELEHIREEFIKEHSKYPLGVCLTKKLHELFHKLYGYDNIPKQFEEFKIRYRMGEFNNILGDDFKSSPLFI